MGARQTTIVRLIFFAKVKALQLERWLRDRRWPIPRWKACPAAFEGERIEVRSRLFVDARPEERAYELGKIANLRAALPYLNGIELPAGSVFSFWRQIGRATARRGFVQGRMLQLGCVVPAIGGGLCQLSNALYELALQTGCEIVERHRHSHRLPGSPARDATVAWNYIDLRFQSLVRMRIELELTDTELVAACVCDGPLPRSSGPSLQILEPPPAGIDPEMQTCATCAEIDCSRHEPVRKTRIP